METSKATVICLAQYKGGTGKTTAVINISACLAKKGYKVLAIDLDQQSSLTVWMGINPIELKHTMRSLLTTQITAEEILVPTQEGVDLLPAHIDLALVELHMPPLEREKILLRKIKPLLARYDYILIDTPPNFIMTTVNAMTAADFLLVPIQPEPLCLYGMSQLSETLNLVQSTSNPALKLLGVFTTLYDTRLSLQRDIVDKVAADWGELTFKTVIKRRSSLLEATLERQSIIKLKPNSDLSREYQMLTEEVIERVQTARSS